MSRIPFVAAVVGALLIGGATTGGTHASWVSTAQLSGKVGTSTYTVKSGNMALTVPASAALDGTLARTATSFQTGTFSVTDTSSGKNLVQQVTASVAGAPAGVTATIGLGTSCSAAVATSVSATKTPSDAVRSQAFCVKALSSTTAVSGNIVINVKGQQQPSGWSTVVQTVTIPVTMAEILNCGTQTAKNDMPVSWTNPAGVTKAEVQWATSANGTYATFADGTSQPAATSYTVTQTAVGNMYYRIKFTGGTVSTSNIVQMTRDNNSGNSNISYCGPVKP